MQHIIEQNSVNQYKKDMTTYAIEVNRRRSVPDVRDGFKLVHRRIIDVMFNHERICATQYVKSASIVGKVMGINHPHGDSSIYDAIVNLATWWSTYVPIIEPHGNFGSMQGDGAAAQRYTEVKIAPFAMDCVLSDLKESKQVVDWVPTFDNRNMEPEYLPVSVPLLLINGTYGIGVGLKSEIPSHNLNEVIDATIKLIKNPNASVVLIPDHCMPVEIIDNNWKAISNKGRGNYIVRGIIDIEKMNTKKFGEHYALVIKSVPDLVSFDKGNPENGGVKYKILEMIKDGKLPQIVGIDEDSHKNDMRCVLHLRKGVDPNFIKEMLYKTTQLQTTCTVNFEVLDGINLMRMSYKSYLEYFIEQRKITKFRMYCNKLENVKTRYHEMDAYVKLLESGEIDNIITMIRNHGGDKIDDNYLMEYMIKKLNITDIQAKFIMNSNLKSLSKAYLERYRRERETLLEKEKICFEKITHDEVILQDIIDELTYYKKKYGMPRKSTIISKADVNNIPQGNFKLVFTENGYVKKINPNEFVGSYKGDNPAHIIKVENTENVLIFSDQGKVFKLPVHKVPVTEKNSLGVDIRILIKGLTSNIIKVIYEPALQDISKKTNKYFLTMVTAGNRIKKLDLEDVLNVSPSGILYTKLSDGDCVKDVIVTPNNLDVIIYSHRKALRIPTSDIPHYRRSTLGDFAMSTDVPVDGISVLYPDCTDIVVITESGKINKFNISGLTKSSRYKAGSSVIKLGKADKIHSIFGVNDDNIIKVVTKNTSYELKVGELQRESSISTGKKILSIKGDIIVKCNIVTNN